MRWITHGRRVADWVLVAALLAFVGVPCVGAIWSHANGTVSITEKRELANLPSLPRTLAAWQRYPKAFDAFATDRFGFRDEVLGIYKWLLTSVFGQSAAAKTIVGKDGWLFLGLQPALEDMSGTGQFSAARLIGLVEQINARGALLAVRQIRFGYVVFPDKYTVYPQYLPSGLYGGRALRRLEDLNRALAASGHHYYFDATEALLAEIPKSRFRLYYPTGTHWNYWGSYLGYQAWARAEQTRLGLSPLAYRFDEFKINAVGGDLYVAGGFKSRGFKIYPPPGAGCQNVKPWRPDAAILAQTGTNLAGLRVAHCDGRGTAMVVHDSYLLSMVQYLGANFRTMHCIWSELDATQFGNLVNALQPNTVLIERVERLLLSSPQTDLPALVKSLGVVGADVTQDGAGRLIFDFHGRRSVRTPARGRLSIDAVTIDGGTARIAGWAALGERPPAAVVAVVDGQVVGEAPVVLPRPDVAASNHGAKLGWSGYEMDVPARFAGGPRVGVDLYLVDFDHYAAIPATVWPGCRTDTCSAGLAVH